MGDAPYNWLEELQFRLVLRDLDAHDLSTIISVGDIFWRPCTDEMYRRSRDWFNGLRHPVIYTPGDNEWFDCWEPGSGGYEPQERLGRLRQIFYSTPAQSLGGKRIPLASQPEFVENVRWTDHSLVFATVHLIGSGNGRWPFPNRTEDDVAASKTRTEAAGAWLRETFSAAKTADASAVVVAMQGAPFDEEPKDREPFEPFLTTLREEAERFQRPVLIAHGDHHQFQVDRQLGLANLTRLEVPGSPDVGGSVTVMPNARSHLHSTTTIRDGNTGSPIGTLRFSSSNQLSTMPFRGRLPPAVWRMRATAERPVACDVVKPEPVVDSGRPTGARSGSNEKPGWHHGHDHLVVVAGPI
jgi:hypothetical protein